MHYFVFQRGSDSVSRGRSLASRLKFDDSFLPWLVYRLVLSLQADTYVVFLLVEIQTLLQQLNALH